MENIDEEEFSALINQAKLKNPWFTEDNIRLAWKGIMHMLDSKQLNDWLVDYPEKPSSVKKIGVIMAGNIPMVGFHDLLCVLMSGHHLKAKLSSQDDVLIPWITDRLTKINPSWHGFIEIVEKLKGMDAVIATGSDNSARYFEYYFKDIPKIIRKNRTSVAIINGKEEDEKLKQLGKDLYLYFGLGCRNVSKIYIPKNYDMVHLLDQLNDWMHVIDNNKYANNYTYQQAIYAMEQIPHYDNGFSLFTQNEMLVSPTSVIYYEQYHDVKALNEMIGMDKDKIQCIVSDNGWFPNSIPFGQAQFPHVWDYADDIDTMRFLLEL